MNIVRTLGIFMALAALSFVLGFFLLARLMPGTPRPAISAAVPAYTMAIPKETEIATPASPPIVHPAASSAAASRSAAHPRTRLASGSGPTLDAVSDPAPQTQSFRVQKPRKLDSEPAGQAPSTADEPDQPPAPRRKVETPAPAKTPDTPPVARPRRRKRHSALPRTEAPAVVDSNDNNSTDDNADTPPEKPRKSRRVRAKSQDEGNGSVDNGDTESRQKAPRASDTEAPTGILYHVHIGSFHSRDAAAQEARRARAKGFETRIVPYARNGRTLYRVQSGAYHDRMRAEAAKQSMQDAELDARISEQQH